MNTRSFVTLLLTCVGCLLAGGRMSAQDFDSVAPVVVKTIPEAGSKDVAPGVVEIKVIFSKEMIDRSWSPVDAWQNSTPAIIGDPRYEADHKTWVMTVKLEPGKIYGYWLNSPKFSGFRDTLGHTAVPYLLTFKTKEQ